VSSKKEDYSLQLSVYPLNKPMLDIEVLEMHFLPMPLNYNIANVKASIK